MAAASKPVLWVGLLAFLGICHQMRAAAPPGFCDVNADGVYNIVDAQIVIDEALFGAPTFHDLNANGQADVGDAQIAVNAALGLGCAVVPKITLVNPSSAGQGQSVTAIFTVANFALTGSVLISFSNPLITVHPGSLTIVNATQVSAVLDVDGTSPTGPSDVTISAGGQSVKRTGGFSVGGGSAAIASLDPGAAPPGTTVSVNVTGVNTTFEQGVTTASFGSGVTVNSVTVHSHTSATVNISVESGAALGLRTVTLTTGGEVATLADTFGVGFPAVLNSISLNAVGVGLTSTVQVTGTHLDDGVFHFPLPATLPSFCGQDTPAIQCTAPTATVVSNDGTTAVLHVTGGSYVGDFAMVVTTTGGSTSGTLTDTNRLSVVTTNSAFVPVISILDNQINSALLPVLPAGQNAASGVEVAVLNLIAISATLPNGENSAYRLVSLFNNQIDPALLPKLAPGESAISSADVSVLNRLIDPSKLPTLPPGENQAFFPVVSSHNSASQTQAQSLALVRPATGSRNGEIAAGTSAGAEVSAPAYPGQTVRLGDSIFTVPYSVEEPRFEQWIHDQGNPVRLVPDRAPVFQGELKGSDGTPLAGRRIAWSAGAFSAEVLAFAAPVVALPDLAQGKPVRRFLATAINQPNPAGVFGADPLGLGISTDFAVRYRAQVVADRAGFYRFWLDSNGFVSLKVGDQRIAGEGALWLVVNLDSGLHELEVVYAKGMAPESLALSWAPPVPGVPRQPISPYYLRAPGLGEARTDASGRFQLPGIPMALDSIWIETGSASFPVERRALDAAPVEFVLAANSQKDNR